ncbi:hypothetical protein Psuf_061220 [Phytohabitans suffuscus]|uniref:HTH arsR-type domain-containing protein n=1 Tax=Phytohabitans suffuscus TaxID=624315 RepID=A0A6F8YRW8_9ACTN|nr:hypothetical protein Psuf_061220 [Phytohabitans suffuscus]
MPKPPGPREENAAMTSAWPKVLRDARLVRRVRRGREIAYTLSDARVAHIVRDAIAHIREEEQG